MENKKNNSVFNFSWLLMFVLLFLSCGNQTPARKFFPDMFDSPAQEAQEANHLSASQWNKQTHAYKVLPANTIPKGFIPYKWKGSLVKKNNYNVEDGPVNPLPFSREVLKRGEAQYQIYCELCHGAKGDSQRSVIIMPGLNLIAPGKNSIASKSDAQYFTTISNGTGILMQSHASQIEVEDRWAIINYIRLLQARELKK